MDIIGKYTSAKVFASIIEDGAVNQIQQLCDSTFMQDCKVRVMPDVHSGAGCVIGLTIEMNSDKICPNLIGVDIGCGMRVVKIKDKNIDFQKLDDIMKRRDVPSGKDVHSAPVVPFDKIDDFRCSVKKREHILCSVGTLGSGNHFIEVCEGKEGYYLIIHSGSRNLGKQVALYYSHVAAFGNVESRRKKIDDGVRLLKSQGRYDEIEQFIKGNKKCNQVPNKDLCFLEGQDSENYLHDMKLCQEYTVLNRKTMRDIIVGKMGFEVDSEFETIHNYIDDHFIRKGAISAQKDEIVLIPMNMRDGCIIARGKGNTDWNCSAPHGAGRIMSRGEAKKQIAIDDYRNSMSGIYTSCVDSRTLDEAPAAYKPFETILNDIHDTVDIVDIIKSRYNYKGV